MLLNQFDSFLKTVRIPSGCQPLDYYYMRPLFTITKVNLSLNMIMPALHINLLHITFSGNNSIDTKHNIKSFVNP